MARGRQKQPTVQETKVVKTTDVVEQPTVQETIKGDKKPEYVVSVEFRDKNDFTKVYTVGQDVTGIDKERLFLLIELGYVELKK